MFMKKNIGWVITSIVLVVALILYICITFYKIEHTLTTEETFLITRQSILQQNLQENIASFEIVADRIFNNDVKEIGHDYYFREMEQDEHIQTLVEKCNVLWARISPDLKEITFYQTTLIEDNEVILSYVCIIDVTGVMTWNITKQFPDFNREETIGVKLYNFIYNRNTI